jgi:protein-S-isoprenylcysteine O-methyltransferase Ste14
MLYRFVRHPLYVGWIGAFWITPTMTVGHLMFAGVLTAYMLIAIPLEERDLIDHLGEAYANYRRRVPALIPLRGFAIRGRQDVGPVPRPS